MATIEHCDFLNPGLKAKLQDNGILYVSALYSVLLSAHGPTSEVDPVETPQDPHGGGVALQAAAVAAVAASEEDTTELHRALPFLSAAELTELHACVSRVHAERRGDGPVTIRSLGDVLASTTTTTTTTTTTELDSTVALSRPRITTFCRALDELLGGGVPTCVVTELSGPPGVGKTQLLQQLAVSCVLPREFGGLDQCCLYVDTEGSFSADRLRQLMVAAVGLVQSASTRMGLPAETTTTARKRPREDKAAEAVSEVPTSEVPPGSASPGLSTPLTALAERFTVDDALARVHYVRCTELADLVALLHTIDAYKEARVPDLGMLLIDSIAFPFRAFQESGSLNNNTSPSSPTSTNNSQRSRALCFACSQLLQHLAATLSLTVVVTNHVTARTIYLSPSSSEQAPGGGGFEGSYARAAGPMSPTSAHAASRGARSNGTNTAEAPRAFPALPQRTTVLIPALGDAWSCGIPTRVLLSFHHYGAAETDTPSTTTSSDMTSVCREDVVVSASRTLVDAEGVVRQYDSVFQHRVARLLCSSTEKRGECCFAITRKGVRDLPRSLT